jgi:class 3 adenylate cyclase/tetratricopeptide (TPR) repeat protein
MATLDHFHQRATQLLSQGAPLPAYDTLAAGLVEFPGDPGLRRLLALALARSGASAQANQILASLVDDGHLDEETVGMFARTFKDLWGAANDANQARQYLEKALHWYSEAHRLSGGYWSGINAATMALLLDDRERATSLARHVTEACLERRSSAPDAADAYWTVATLGEAALILGDRNAAATWYREATANHAHGLGDVVSTRRNARLILRHQRADAAEIEACFRIPRVAVFAGHLIDRPGRPVPRFPEELQEHVRAALLEILQRRDVAVGYSSAGNGGDILFLECLDTLGADSHIVLPYNRDQFLGDSVAVVPGSTWEARFGAALKRATHVITASEQRMPGNAMSYEYGFRLLDGTAALRAEQLDTELVCIAVWDGGTGDGPGGTRTAVDHWRRAGRQIEIVDLSAIAAKAAITSPSRSAAISAPPQANRDSQTFDAQVVGLLFADVAGFSKLAEEQIPTFIERYMGEIGRVLAAFPDQPILANTWGDGLYLVFESVPQAGAFALRLSETMRGIDWTTHDLPATLGIRIAIHAGPAYSVTDPVTGRPNYLGAHVSFAARIEPVTPTGVVYGSGAFAALAKSADVQEFAWAYVGPTPLAKGAGTTPMYVIQRRSR